MIGTCIILFYRLLIPALDFTISMPMYFDIHIYLLEMGDIQCLFFKIKSIGFKKFCGKNWLKSRNRMAGNLIKTDDRARFFLFLISKISWIMVIIYTLKISLSHFLILFHYNFIHLIDILIRKRLRWKKKTNIVNSEMD